MSWKLGANFQKNGGGLWCAKQLFYGFNFVNAGRKRKWNWMPQPFVAMLVDNRVELWMFLVSWVLFTGRMVNKNRCEKLLQWETIFDAGAITCAVTPTDLLQLHHLLRCMGSGSAADRRQPVKISIYKHNTCYDIIYIYIQCTTRLRPLSISQIVHSMLT